jgi:hypothetical protein
MDDFLTSLYEEEREKIAAADLGTFMSTLPAQELEEFLGLTKLGVGGPENPELPNGGEKLDKEQSKTDSEVAKMQDIGPPNRNEDEGKKEAMARRIEKIAREYSDADIKAMATVTRGLQGYYPKGSRLRALRESTPAVRTLLGLGGGLALGAPGVALGHTIGGKKGAIIGGMLGGGVGAGLGVASGGHTADLNRRIYAAMDAQDKEKKSQGFGDPGADDMGGMENTAAAKAEIVMRTMKVAASAPTHIKEAAARFAGKEIANLTKTAKLPSSLRRDLLPNGYVR